jgi:hypothetical protein
MTIRRWLGLFSFLLLPACDIGTDAATRLACNIEAGAGRLGREDGASYRIRHDTPSQAGECDGPYKVQIDKVGALFIWCMNTAGAVTSSHSTSWHARFVDRPQTCILDKPAGSPLVIDLERLHGRAVITAIH